jgi:hypothetical protein
MTEALDILTELGYTYTKSNTLYAIDTNYGTIYMTESQVIEFALQEMCQ